MHAQSYSNTTGYLVIAVGVGLSLISALVPHFTSGYTLKFSVFAAGVLPYLVFGVAVPLHRSAMTTLAGLFVVLAHAWLVFNQRIVGQGDYSDGLIYYGPMVLALIVLPFALIGFRNSMHY